MCMEDIRIGRKTNSSEKTVSLNTGGYVPVVGPNDDRTALIISVCGDGGTAFMSSNESPGIATGLRINAATQPYVMTIETHGDLVRRPWQGYATSNLTISVFQVFLADK